MQTEILIVTNGYKGTLPSIEYGAHLARLLGLKTTLLGATEKINPAAIDDHHPLEDIFARAIEIFKQNEVEYSLEIQNGDAEEIAPQKTKQGDYMVVAGPLGRTQFKRLFTRRSIRHLMEKIESPIVYVPNLKLPLKKVLISIGGLGYEATSEHLAMQIAVKSRAEITLLHIIPPMNLDYPTARAVRDNWQKLEETDTPIGRSLRAALAIANNEGLTASVKAREGNIVEQIGFEVEEGDYDLLCMGSSFSASALRQMYASNVTSEVAENLSIPLLCARYQRDQEV